MRRARLLLRPPWQRRPPRRFERRQLLLHLAAWVLAAVQAPTAAARAWRAQASHGGPQPGRQQRPWRRAVSIARATADLRRAAAEGPSEAAVRPTLRLTPRRLTGSDRSWTRSGLPPSALEIGADRLLAAHACCRRCVQQAGRAGADPELARATPRSGRAPTPLLPGQAGVEQPLCRCRRRGPRSPSPPGSPRVRQARCRSPCLPGQQVLAAVGQRRGHGPRGPWR